MIRLLFELEIYKGLKPVMLKHITKQAEIYILRQDWDPMGSQYNKYLLV